MSLGVLLSPWRDLAKGLSSCAALTPTLTPTQAHDYGHLWTDWQRLGRKCVAKRRIWTPMDKGKRSPKPLVADAIPVPLDLTQGVDPGLSSRLQRVGHQL